jgi:formylglycine-generating enzyme required for sulfatase activity
MMKMNLQAPSTFRWGALPLLFLLIGVGCAPVPAAPSAASQPMASPSYASLTALKTVVKLLRDNTPTWELQEDESVGIQGDDRIAVEKEGRGRLTFYDDIVVEVFRDSEVRLSEARLEPGGSVFVRLKQSFGHTHAELKSTRDERLKIETDYGTITAFGKDAEVLVCHAEALTCMTMVRGEAEVEAQGQVVAVKGGEATYILPGQPPKPAICANMEQVRQWMDEKRGTEEVEPLGALVSGWPQQPCSVASSGPSPTPTSGPVPAGADMVSIPAGQYVVGVAGGDDFHMPAQEISLPEYWIDPYEVTQAEYQVFLDQTGHPAPTNGPGEPNHPVSGVSWDDAAAYCTWANKRLPTEAEWEVAARGPGPEPPLYPWGSDPIAGGQADQLPLLETYAVGSQAFNQSPFGVYDMAGNVWEWVGEPYSPLTEGYHMLRGGRYGFLKDMAYRQPAESTDTRFLPVTGFRCAADRVAGE